MRDNTDVKNKINQPVKIGYLIILSLLGGVVAFTLVLSFKDSIFSGVTVDYLFIFSLANFFFGIFSLIVSMLILSVIRRPFYRPYIVFFLMGFIFTIETIIILVLYDRITFFGIHVPMGYCPWKHIRGFITVVFILTYISLYRAYNNISRIVESRQNKGK